MTHEQKAKLKTILGAPGLRELIAEMGVNALAQAIPVLSNEEKITKLQAAIGNAVVLQVNSWPTAIAVVRSGMPESATNDLAQGIYKSLEERDATLLGKYVWLLVTATLAARGLSNIPDPLPDAPEEEKEASRINE